MRERSKLQLITAGLSLAVYYCALFSSPREMGYYFWYFLVIRLNATLTWCVSVISLIRDWGVLS